MPTHIHIYMHDIHNVCVILFCSVATGLLYSRYVQPGLSPVVGASSPEPERVKHALHTARNPAGCEQQEPMKR